MIELGPMIQLGPITDALICAFSPIWEEGPMRVLRPILQVLDGSQWCGCDCIKFDEPSKNGRVVFRAVLLAADVVIASTARIVIIGDKRESPSQ